MVTQTNKPLYGLTMDAKASQKKFSLHKIQKIHLQSYPKKAKNTVVTGGKHRVVR